MRILVIEDNLAIATNLYDHLEGRGHAVEVARDGAKGLRRAVEQQFDVIVLDLTLPRLDGMALCRKLRTEALSVTPILMLTARDTLKDKLLGFESGADDYLVKPFALEEVEARLDALHRRSASRTANRVIQVGALRFDAGAMAVQFADSEVKLPPKCMRLLGLLMSEPGRVFTRKELEVALWSDEQETSDRLRTHMHVLRRALVRSGGYDPIETVHSIGFRLQIGK